MRLKFSVNVKNIGEIRQFQVHMTKRLQEKIEIFLQRLGELGLQDARVAYEVAPYAGEKDTGEVVQMQFERDKLKLRIVATGRSILFIEFGTGVLNADSNEARRELNGDHLVGHGEYGYGLADNPFGWWYIGDMPSNPPTGTTRAYNRKNTIHTLGQAGNPFMYNARKKMIDSIESIAREVFGNDR